MDRIETAESSRSQRPSRPWRVVAATMAALLLVSSSFAAMAKGPAPARAATLQQELERLVSNLDGSAGVYVLDLRSGRSAAVNPQVGFPMASTVKVPVAVHILSLVDEGKLDLRQQIQLGEGDIYPEMGGPLDTTSPRVRRSPACSAARRCAIPWRSRARAGWWST